MREKKDKTKEFFKRCGNQLDSFLEAELAKAKTEAERKRIRKLMGKQ